MKTMIFIGAFVVLAVILFAVIYGISLLWAAMLPTQKCACGEEMEIKAVDIYSGKILYRCPKCRNDREIVVREDGNNAVTNRFNN